MPTTSTSVDLLMEQLRAGSEDAAWELINVYGPHIHRVVRRMLHRRMRSQFDSVDFVQAVWTSFFREPNQLRSFETADEMVKFLAKVARNKVVDESRRRFGTQKHDLSRTQSLDDSEPEVSDLMARQPTPSDVAVARERWVQFMEESPVVDRQVLRMRFQGISFDEIATRLDISERTARRIVERVTMVEQG